MIGTRTHTDFDARRVTKPAEAATFKNLGHASATVRRYARQLIGRKASRKTDPRPEGQPPRTRTGRFKQAVLYYVDRRRQRAVIGLSARIADDAGAAHERGGVYRGQRFPRRPMMAPAMEKALPRLPAPWRNSIN